MVAGMSPLPVPQPASVSLEVALEMEQAGKDGLPLWTTTPHPGNPHSMPPTLGELGPVRNAFMWL